MWNKIIESMKGSVIKFISKNIILNLEIPIPKNSQILLEWNQRIQSIIIRKKNIQNELIQKEKFIKNRLNEIIHNEKFLILLQIVIIKILSF
jgi:hypothetical protein